MTSATMAPKEIPATATTPATDVYLWPVDRGRGHAREIEVLDTSGATVGVLVESERGAQHRWIGTPSSGGPAVGADTKTGAIRAMIFGARAAAA